MPHSLCYVVSTRSEKTLVDVRNYVLSTNCDVKKASALVGDPEDISYFKISLEHLVKSEQIGNDIKKIVARTCSHGTTPIFKLSNEKYCFILKIDFK